MRSARCVLVMVVCAGLAACGGSARPSATPPPSPAATATSAADASPATAPIPVRHLALVPDIPFPARLNLVIAWGGYRHGGPGYFAVERYSANAAGTVRVADLLPAVAGDTGRLMGMAASPDTTWAAVCHGQSCGSEGPLVPGALNAPAAPKPRLPRIPANSVFNTRRGPPAGPPRKGPVR